MRLLLGLTQADMGRRMAISSDTIRRWETPPDRKRHEPVSQARLAQMRQLAAELGVKHADQDRAAG